MMKKYLPILLLLMTGSAVHAGGMTTRHQSSIQSIQTPTITQTQRTGNSYSVSGSNVNTSYTYCSAGCDGNSPTNTTVAGGVGRISYNTNGTSTLTDVAASQGVVCTADCSGTPTYSSTGTFSFANSYTQADVSTATGTNATVTAGASGAAAVPGTINNGHSIVLGGSQTSGTTVTGQFITEVSVFN